MTPYSLILFSKVCILIGALISEVEATNGKWGYVIGSHSERHKIDCDHHNMVVVYLQDDGPFCECVKGYYLLLRNVNVLETVRCYTCEICENDEIYHYEIRPCRKYMPPLCCKNPNMTAVVTKYGDEDCVLPGETYSNSDGVLDCTGIPRSSLVVRDDGIQYCRCEHGYFLHQKNVDAPNTKWCAPCTDCSQLKSTPYEIAPCSNFDDAHCCARSDMKVRPDTRWPGVYECFVPEPHQTTTSSTTSVTHGQQLQPNASPLHADTTKVDAADNNVLLSGCQDSGMAIRTDEDGSKYCACKDYGMTRAKKTPNGFVCGSHRTVDRPPDSKTYNEEEAGSRLLSVLPQILVPIAFVFLIYLCSSRRLKATDCYKSIVERC